MCGGMVDIQHATAENIGEEKQEGQHELTGQRAANFRRDLGAT